MRVACSRPGATYPGNYFNNLCGLEDLHPFGPFSWTAAVGSKECTQAAVATVWKVVVAVWFIVVTAWVVTALASAAHVDFLLLILLEEFQISSLHSENISI